MHFSEIITEVTIILKRLKLHYNAWNVFSKLKPNYLRKIRGYPQSSSWIPIALVKNYFSVAHNNKLCKNTSVLGSIILKHIN